MKRTLSLWGCVLLLASLVTNLFAQFDASKVYTIKCNNPSIVDKYMQDNGSGTLVAKALNNNSYWKFISTGNEGCYYVQNVLTGSYIQKTSVFEVTVNMGAEPVEIVIKNDPAKGSDVFGLASTDREPHDFADDNTWGANFKTNETVQGFSAALGARPNSFWKIEEATMPDVSLSLTSPYQGSVLADGDFFLYNVESDLWLQNNDKNTDDWNTRGATGTYGFDFTISAVSGGWQLNPKFGNNHSMNASNFYLDTSQDVTAWTIEPIEVQGMTNAYIIKCGGKILGLDNNDNLAGSTNKRIWQLVTRAERIAYLQANATKTNPIDATFLIQDPGFANANERASSWVWNRNGGNLDDNRTYRNRRSYAVWNSTSFTLAQTINNVPNGYYKLNMKGYYRDGNKDQVAERRAAGTENLIGKYYINNDKASVMSILDGASATWSDGRFYYPAESASHPYGFYPDNADAFNRIFQEYPNSYMNAGIPSTVTDKTIRIGLEKTTANANDWLAWDEFYLTYLGPIDLSEYLAGLNSAIQAAEEYDSSTTTEVLRNALNTALTNANGALTSDNPDYLSEVTAALNTALGNAKAVDVTFLSKTIPLASADGADTSAAEDFIVNGTDAATGTNILSSLRIARRVANAEKQADIFEGQAPAEGEFYLYNVGAQRFLCGGNDWGAHASLGFPGVLVTLVADGSNFKIDTHLSNGGDNHFLNDGAYMDASAYAWTFEDAGNGKYNIVKSGNSGQILGWETGTYNNVISTCVTKTNATNQWKLVTKAQRDALYEAASAVTNQPASPVDVSYLIKSPNFSQREDVSAWTLKNSSIWGRGGNHPDFAIEAYDQTSASVEQTVSELKPGTYKLKVQAYYRDGNFDNQANILKNGGELLQLATLFAGNKSALIQNVTVGADKAPGMGRYSEVGNMPDGIDDACLYFQNGLYWAELDNIVVTTANPSITFGARKTEKRNNGDWFVLDNFRLEYLGAYVDLSEVKQALQDKINEATSTMGSNVADFLQQAINDGNDAMNELQDADIIVNATTALTTAINTYNAGKADLTALIQTVAKAQAEGVTGYDNAVADVLAAAADAFALTAAQKLYDVRAARKVKALGKPDVYTGSAPAAGKYRLFNIGTGMFLGMGSDYNTHAAIDQVGVEVELVEEGQDFILKTIYGGNYFNANPFVDTPETDKAIYTFTAVSGNIYTIKQGENLLGWNPNVEYAGAKYWNNISNTNGASADDANFQWKLVSEDELAAMEANAATGNPVDVSYKINNPSLNRLPNLDMWSKTADGGNGGARVNTPATANNGDRVADYAYEFFDTNSFSFTQTVTGLKPGYYKVSVQGFYRDGNGAYQAGVVNENGELLQKAYLVGGNAQALLPNVASAMDVVPGLTDIQATDRGNMPNMPNSSIEFFEHGAYLTTVDAKVGANGELTIGVKKDEKPHDNDWAVIDNFRLYYLGNPYTSMSILGDFTGGWDFTEDKHMAQDANDPAIWTLVIDNFKVDKDWYEYKATANDTWGVYEKPMQGSDPANQNWQFGTEAYPYGYYKLVFTLNTETHELTLVPTKKTVVTIAENDTYVPEAAEDVTIVLNRSIVGSDTWNTFCVPFDIDNAALKAQFGDDVKVAEYSETAEGESSTVNFSTMATPAVTANVPVLLKSNTTETSFVFGGAIKTGEAKVEGINYDFVGTYTASTTIPENDYFLSSNKLYKSAGATTIAGTRAYIKAKAAGARVVKITFDGVDDTTTGIETIGNGQQKVDNMFDLQGRRVNNASKSGVYIMNGKKVVVK